MSLNVIPKRNTTKSDEMRNGANGSSVFILTGFLENLLKILEPSMSNIPIIAPAQNAIKIAAKFMENGNNQLMPRTSLPSPSPIHLPPENHQREPKIRNITGPKRRSALSK